MCECPRRDSNPHCTDFKSVASADWATGAEPRQCDSLEPSAREAVVPTVRPAPDSPSGPSSHRRTVTQPSPVLLFRLMPIAYAQTLFAPRCTGAVSAKP